MALLLLLSGCQKKNLALYNEGYSDEKSIVFGFLDMSNAPVPLDEVKFEQITPENRYWYARIDDGLFYMEGVPLGSYRLVHFWGIDAIDLGLCGYQSCCIAGYSGHDWTYRIPWDRQEPLELKKPGIYFLGAWEWAGTSNQYCTFTPPVFGLAASEKPSEKELLQRLLTHSTGTRWEGRIRAKLESRR